VEGQNVTVDYQWADDQLDHLPELVQEIIRRRPAVIVGNVLAVRVVQAATTSIPIVFVAGSDPVEIGLVSSLNRPGGNITGVVFTSSDLSAKRLELLDGLVAKSSTIAVLLDPNAPGYELQKKDAEDAGRTLGRRLLFVDASDERELHAAFEAIAKNGAGGLLLGSSAYYSAGAGKLQFWRRDMDCLRRAAPAVSQRSDCWPATGRVKPTPTAVPATRWATSSAAARQPCRNAGRAGDQAGPRDQPCDRQSPFYRYPTHIAGDCRRGDRLENLAHLVEGACYSITLSARSRNDSGIVTPSAAAALRLMNSSNLVGCSTGRSPTLAPFKMRST
jgi:ABC transporter substrate binding protein